jgi:hypothetical protein
MTERLAWLLATIYVPMMWALVAVSALLGVAGVVAPGRLRDGVRVFTQSRPNRILGVVLMIVGAEMFIRGPGMAVPLLVRTLGVLLFVDGGVRLILPTLSVIVAEWFVARSDHWYRVLGLVCLVLAYLFYHATRLPLGEVIQGVNLHYTP